MATSTFTEIIEAVQNQLARSDVEEVRALTITGLSLIEDRLANDPYFWVKTSEYQSTGTVRDDGKYEHVLPERFVKISKVFDNQQRRLTYTSEAPEFREDEYIILEDSIITMQPDIIIYFIQRPEKLSAQRLTNELSENYGNILFYGALEFVLQSLKDPGHEVANVLVEREIRMVKSRNKNVPTSAQMSSQYSR